MKTVKLSVTTILSFLTLSTVFLAPAALADEQRSDSSMGIGFHLGRNYSDFKYTKNSIDEMKTNRTGNLFGIHFENLSSGFLNYRIEANYSSKGYNLDQFSSITHNYLQVPLLFKLSPLPGPFKVFAEAGPAASLHLSDKVEVANASVVVNDDSSSWDFSLIAGLGVGLNLGNLVFELEGRYDYGLKSLNNSNSVEVKSRAFQTIAGITFLM